jgi:hypothetical protein
VRFGLWLFIRTYHDGYHLFPREMLFNVEEDPHEQRDLAEARPNLRREGAAQLLDWHDEMMAGSTTDVDPMWTVMRKGGLFHARGRLRECCGYLERTGRGWAVPELKRRHPGDFAG